MNSKSFFNIFLNTQLPQDLSGDLGLHIYLWVKYGSGKGCICHLQVVPKPGAMSMAGMKVRANHLMAEGIKLAWNHHVHFEVHGICSVLQGKGDFALQSVKVAGSQAVRPLISLHKLCILCN